MGVQSLVYNKHRAEYDAALDAQRMGCTIARPHQMPYIGLFSEQATALDAHRMGERSFVHIRHRAEPKEMHNVWVVRSLVEIKHRVEHEAALDGQG